MTLASEHQQLLDLFVTYQNEYMQLTDKGVKASAPRARKALSEISKLCKSQRSNISDTVKKLKKGGTVKKGGVAKKKK
jgi:hypothetical protein